MKQDNEIPTMDIQMSLRYLGVLLQAMGMYVPSKKRGAKKVFQLIYCSFVHFISFSNVARFSLGLKMEVLSMMSTLSYFVMYAGGALYSLVFLITSRHWEAFQGVYSDFQLLFGFNINMKFYSKTMKIVCCLAYISAFGSALSAFVTLMYSDIGMFNKFFIPLNNLQGTAKLFAGIYMFTTNFIFFGSQLSSVMCFFGLTYCLVKEYGTINSKISKMIEKGFMDEDFEKVRHQHSCLCEVMKQANTVLSHFIFFTYVTVIPVLCFQLYGLIRGSLPLDEFYLGLSSAFGGTASCFSATIAGAVLSSKAHGCLDDVMKVKCSEVSLKTAQSISIFVSRLTGPSFGLSMYGLFTVDSSAILTILGTLLTYAIVVLQFQPMDPVLMAAATNLTN